MKAKKIIFISLSLMFVLNIRFLFAQDPHLSQYDASPMIINAGTTGMFDNEKFRGATQFRNQWSSAGCNYTTTTLSFDMAYDERWGFGCYIINDDALQVYNAFNFVGSAAYRITEPGQKKIKLAVGLQAGVINKSIKMQKLLFDNQYSNGNFDSDLPTGEVFQHNSRIMPEVNFGIRYDGNFKEDKIKPYAGIAISHVTNPRESFYGAKDSHLPLKYFVNGGAQFDVSEGLVLDPKFYFMRQRNVNDINIGMDISYLIEQFEMTVIGGGFYRFKDAAIIDLGFKLKNVTYMMSYDLNISYLKKFTNSRGGLEFSVIFTGASMKSSQVPSKR